MDYKTAIEDYEKLTNEDDRIKEVYTQFGLAVFHAQLLEQQAINLIVFSKLENKQLTTKPEIDDLWDNYDLGTRTLGTLIKEIKQLYNLSDEDASELQEILKLRNYISHDYFRFNSGLFYADGGKQRMIKDFVDFINKCQLIEPKLDKYTEDYCAKIGLTQELADKHVEETIKLWEQRQINENHQTIKK